MQNSKRVSLINYNNMNKKWRNVVFVATFLATFANGSAMASSSNDFLDSVAAVENVQQEKIKLTGTVSDDEGPLPGATVLVKGTTIATMTNFDGEYTLNDVPEGSVIVVTSLGYKTQEVKLTAGKTIINFMLDMEATDLDEVVVTALGMKRSTKALGYSMTELKGEELNANLVNPVAALQGKVAGVEISGSDGGTFGSSKIQIRGASTLGKNNQPIFVVDGVILSNDVKEGNPDWDDNPNDFGNALKNLNPDDFETVSVLKGAAATALYGSRGLNGAVVITTKSGNGNAGLGINVTQTLGVDFITQQPRLQNSFGPGTISGNVSYGEIDPITKEFYKWDNYGQFTLNSNGKPTLIGGQGMGYGPAFTGGQQIQYYDGTYRAYLPKKNNFREAYETGFNTNTNISIQGGNEKTTFYTSTSYKYAHGTLPRNSFQRFSFLGKASHKITDKVRLEASMTFSNSMPKNPQRNIGENFANGTWNRMYDPSYSKHKYKGTHGGLASNTYGDEYGNMPGRGVWWSMYENNYYRLETAVRPTLKVDVDLLDWLKWTTEGSLNYYYTRQKNEQPGSGFANDGGYFGLSLNDSEQTNLNTNFIVNKPVGEDWNLTGFVRGEFFDQFAQYQSMNTDGGLVIPNKYFIDNSKLAPQYSAIITDTKRMLSIAFQAGFSWRDQVYVDVTGRNDWSSSLVYTNRSGNYSYFYPSINGSWLFSNSMGQKKPDWLYFGKLRASWAQVGNDTSPYTINSAYTLFQGTKNATNYYGLTMPETMVALDLKPERKNSWEIGTDLRFIDGRIGVDFTFYKENTKDQIMNIAVPYESGVTSKLINAGNIQNSGVELALNFVPVRTRDIEWELDFTYTKNNNKIIELSPDVANYITLAGDISYGNYRMGSVAQVGKKYGTILSDATVKMDTQSGLPFMTYNGTWRGAWYTRNEAEIKEIGSVIPDFLGSMSSRLRYKNWTLTASLDARFGGYVSSYNSRYGTAYGFLETSLPGQPGHGGLTYTSIWDNRTYYDGVIPNGIVPTGTSIPQPDGANYVVSKGSVSDAGQTYQELIDAGKVDPMHASFYHYWNNAWSGAGQDRGVISDAWFKKLNYIALRNVSLTYQVPAAFRNKVKAKNLNLTLTGYNLGYLLNSMPNKINPESVAGTAAGEFRIRSFQGVTSSFTFTVNVGF